MICATPHVWADHAVLIDELPSRVGALNAVLVARGIPVQVVTGRELAAPRAAGLSDDELRAISLGGSGRWLLIEPGAGPIDGALDDAVDALHARGMRCVIAHPERHAGADATERLAGLVARGALVQVAAALLVGHDAAPTILDWAGRGLVHLVASDAHSARAGRPAAVSAGLEALLSVPRLAPHLDWIARTAPHAVLAGRSVTSPF